MDSDGLVSRLALDTLQLIYHIYHGLSGVGRNGTGPLGEVELGHNATLMGLLDTHKHTYMYIGTSLSAYACRRLIISYTSMNYLSLTEL